MLDLGYFPQLPVTVTSGQHSVSNTFGSGIDGRLLNVGLDGYSTYVVRNLPLPSGDACKAYCLARGYSKPWSYLGVRLTDAA